MEDSQTTSEADRGGMLRGLGGYRDLKSAATIDAMIHYAETLLGIRFTRVRKNRYNARCPFHADTQERFMAYVNKDDEVRFHCFGACKGDWDIYGLIIVAFDWDELGRNGIERMAAKSGGWVYYLGGLAADRDAYNMLKPVAKAISGFSLNLN